VTDREELFEVTIAAGTLQSAPTTAAMSFVDGIVTGVEFVVPPGPSGRVGFALFYGGVRQLPRTDGAFYVTDDEVIRRSLTGFPSGSRWQLVGFNTDIFPHTIEVRFLIDELPPKRPSRVAIPTILQPNQPAPVGE
jgi:hypothetical protein